MQPLFIVYMEHIKFIQAMVHYAMHLYYEAAVTILALITLGKYLEAISKGKTLKQLKSLWD